MPRAKGTGLRLPTMTISFSVLNPAMHTADSLQDSLLPPHRILPSWGSLCDVGLQRH